MTVDLSDLHRIPNQHGIGEQAQAACLVHNFVQVARAELAPVGKEQAAACQIVATLAMAKLELHGILHLFVIKIAKNED